MCQGFNFLLKYPGERARFHRDIVQCIRRDNFSLEQRFCMCVCVCPNIFSETTGPIEAKFHVEPPWNRGRKFIQMVQAGVQVICCSSLLSTSGGRGLLAGIFFFFFFFEPDTHFIFVYPVINIF